jgi:hypothetical protein
MLNFGKSVRNLLKNVGATIVFSRSCPWDPFASPQPVHPSTYFNRGMGDFGGLVRNLLKDYEI